MMSYVNTVSIVNECNTFNDKTNISRSCSPAIIDISESPTPTTNGTTYIRVYTDGKKKLTNQILIHQLFSSCSYFKSKLD